MDLIKYRLWCSDESAWVYWWKEVDEDIPSTCPNDSSHTIDATKGVTVVNQVHDSLTFSSEGYAKVLSEPLNSSRMTSITPNWCDPCTWYLESIPVTGVELTIMPGETRTRFSMPHKNIIDLKHGRMTKEDLISEDYSISVYVDGVKKTEHTPFNGEDKDFEADYDEGQIIFKEEIPEESIVTADYNYASDSCWKLIPDEGKSIRLTRVEVQFTQDIIIKDTVYFLVYGYVDVFAPHLLDTNGGPYPSHTKIPLKGYRYKTMSDYIADSNGCFPMIPPIGGDDRGTRSSILQIPWDYQSTTDLHATLGMELRVGLDNNRKFSGQMATATFYCLSENEPMNISSS